MLAPVPRSEQRKQRLLEADAAAWDAYGVACRRDAPDDVRRSLLERAIATMNELACCEQESRGVS